MSIESIQNNITRTRRELADLQKKRSEETKSEVEKSKRIGQIEGSITSTTSISTLQSKQREIIRYSEDISRIQAKKADTSKKIADKTSEIHRYEVELLREQERERKKVEESERKRQREQIEHQKHLTRELETQRKLLRDISPPISRMTMGAVTSKKYDLFISHASEDKDDFVRPLANALKELGINVWYDEFMLTVGDSLRRSIDYGLGNSRFGVVVLSGSFFAKNWPQYELDGLVAKEMAGQKVVLPIWHKVTKDEVMSYSPSLADKVALNSSILSIEEIAIKLAEVIKN